jgi:3-hydroxy-3-methylglutaryl CoA synthase
MNELPKVINYDILSSGGFDDLASQVREAVKLGWQPFGSGFAKEYYCCQPIVLYEGQKQQKKAPSQLKREADIKEFQERERLRKSAESLEGHQALQHQVEDKKVRSFPLGWLFR